MTVADPEDILSDALQTLYDYAPITHSSAGSLFTYAVQPQPHQHISDRVHHSTSDRTSPSNITISLTTPETQANNWSLHASSIWVSSLFIADHLADLQLDLHIRSLSDANPTSPRPLRVLELGAGAGLPGILIAKTYEVVQVTLSDYPDEILIHTLEENILRNGVPKNCSVVPYAWGSDPSTLLHNPQAHLTDADPTDGEELEFDIIIAVDTLWNSSLHVIFTRTLLTALRRSPRSRVHLVAGLHTGRYTLQAFMESLAGFGFDIEDVKEREVREHSANGVCREWDVNRAESEDERERRRWVVWMVLKWNEITLGPRLTPDST